MNALQEQLRAALPVGAALGVAVSGGGDSMALLHLAAGLGQPLRAVTVDHGLRPEAAQEAALVAQTCAKLGVSHDILRWRGWDGQGNLQAQARAARYALIADWARGHGLDTVLLGHTLDDQAETLLMRLARGSGVDGLAAMAVRHHAHGMLWLRPMLSTRRQDLRDYLRGQGLQWAEDPSNQDDQFERIKIRKALTRLGLDPAGLAQTAQRMGLAREVLSQTAQQQALRISRCDLGIVRFQAQNLQDMPEETRMRLLSGALCWVSGADYRPRLQALQSAYAAVRGGTARNLHGCMLIPHGDTVLVARELRAVENLRCPADQLWDGRWQASGPAGAELRVLGQAGLAQCPDWRDSGLPRPALISLPGLWRGHDLLAAPGLKQADRGRVLLAQGRAEFAQSLKSH